MEFVSTALRPAFTGLGGAWLQSAFFPAPNFSFLHISSIEKGQPDPRDFVYRAVNPRPHNLNHPLYNLRFFILRLFFVASFLKIIYTKERDAPCYQHERAPNHKITFLRKATYG